MTGQERALSEEQVRRLQVQYLGKRIKFKNNIGEWFTGTCQFLGYNKFLPSWGLQITVGRTPVQHVDYNSIILVEPKNRYI